MDWLELIGRLIFVVIFVMSGITHFAKREDYVAYARMKGAPAPTLLVPFTGLMILAGGILVGIGVWADLGALLIAAFLVPTAYFMHNFWTIDDPQMRMNEQAHFMKNMTMAGAALVMLYMFQQFGGQIGLTAGDPSLFG
jgi:putative oxidoreductase